MLKPEGISDFIQKSRKQLYILVLLLIFIYIFFFFYIINSTSNNINEYMDIYHHSIDKYISERVEQTKNFSTLSGDEIDEMLLEYDNIYAWYQVDFSGNINYNYKNPELTGVSFYEHSIFQEVRESGTYGVYLLPYFLGGNEAVLAVAYPGDEEVNIAVYSFTSLLNRLPEMEDFRVSGYDEGNIILSNKEELEYEPVEEIEGDHELSLKDGVFVTSQEFTETDKKIYVVYDIAPQIENLLYFGISLLVILILIFLFSRNARRNSKNILEDLDELKTVSNQLSATLEEKKDLANNIEDIPEGLDPGEMDLNPERIYSPEMKSVVKSYQQMVGEIHNLLHRVTMQGEEIAAINDSLTDSLTELEEYQDKLETFFKFFNNIDPEKSLSEFMQEILNILLTLIPEGEAGSIGIIEGDSFHYLAQKGYDDLLLEVEFPRDIIFVTEEARIYHNMHKVYHKNMPEKYIEIFERVGSPRIRSSLAMGLKTDEIIGNIFIDNLSDSKAFGEEDKRMLEAVSRVISLYIYLKVSKDELKQAYMDMVKALVEAVEIKDRYTKGHSERVAVYSTKLGKLLGLSEDRIDLLRQAATLHDIGKIGIAEHILNKPGPLTGEEYNQIKKHSSLGSKILSNVENLKDLAKIVRHHHERWDGQGYPEGLSGDDIPLESRIIAIFDAFDTILTARSYKEAMPLDMAVEEIRKNAGSQFDPHLVEIFVENVSKNWLDE